MYGKNDCLRMMMCLTWGMLFFAGCGDIELEPDDAQRTGPPEDTNGECATPPCTEEDNLNTGTGEETDTPDPGFPEDTGGPATPEDSDTQADTGLEEELFKALKPVFGIGVFVAMDFEGQG